MLWNSKWFPGTNLQDINLDWILKKVSALRGGSTGQYLYKKSDKDFDFGWKTGGGGGGGTSDYLDLDNKPSINNVELIGNKTAADLGLATPSDIPVVPVQSVNGKTGVVVLSASDVGAYVKPARGIPKTDLANDVQTSLNKADSAYRKPESGIPKTDLSSAVQTSLDKADSALQVVPPAYRTAVAQDAIDAAQDSNLATIESRLNAIGKVLWTGDFSGPGTLTIPDLNSYRIVIYYNDSGNNYPLMGTPYRGGTLYGTYNSTSITQFAYRFDNVGNNTISIDQTNQGISDGTHTTYANDSIYCHIYRVVGIIPV